MPSIVYYSARNNPIAINYRLRRDFRLNGAKVEIPNGVVRKVDDIDEERFLKQEFGSLILEFIDTIRSNVPSSDLALFYNNFNDVKTRVRDFKKLNFLCNGNVVARWVPKSKTVELSGDNSLLTINHELFHVSSTYKDLERDMYFSGFHQYKSSKNQIGLGLNEGYTQYLAEKYFSHLPIFKAYPFEKSVADVIELIVGERMQSLYFNANLDGLVLALERYNSRENIYRFIRGLDVLCSHMNDRKLSRNSNLIRVDCAKGINLFLIETYVKKLILEFGELNEDEIYHKLGPLLVRIPNKVRIDGEDVSIFDACTLRDNLRDVFAEYDGKIRL